MAEDQIAQIEARISAMESERRRYRLSMTLALLSLTIVSSLGAFEAGKAERGPRTIEGREFIIRGGSGQTLFYVGPEKDGVVLVIRDQTGRITARLPQTPGFVPLSQR